MFSYNIHTTIDIDAGAAEIWRVLTDFSRYDEWNPMLRNVQVGVEPGALVRFEVHRDGTKPLRLQAKIALLNEPDALSWRGGRKGILTGEHYFRIESLGEGRCRFHHGEQFKGLLLLLAKGVLKDAPAVYRSMNQALKKRVEDHVGPAVRTITELS
jgi:hypothetical protein